MREIAAMASAASDDELFALLDNAVSDADRARLEAMIAQHPALKARLDRLRESNALIAASFPKPSGGDQHLVALVEAGFAARRERQRAPVQQIPQWRRYAAAAAGLAFTGAGGFWAGNVSRPAPSLALVAIEPGDRLYAAVDVTPSGQSATLSAGQSVKPILTFRSGNGEYCREVQFDSGAAASLGIACRTGDDWRMVVLRRAEGAANSGGGYATVGETTIAVIQETYSRLKGGAPLSPEEERTLITSGWKSGADQVR